MSDTFDALRTPIEPVDPDAEFAARLRRRLEDALLTPTPTRGGTEMTTTETTATETHAQEAWPPTLTPYICVNNARQAIDWYVDVLGARQRGEPYVGDDGSIGHAELAIGDAVLMLSDPWPEGAVEPPEAGRPHSVSIHIQVDDVDATVERAAAKGATIGRQPEDQPYGRVADLVDPFGHRWYLNQPPASATRVRHGDIAYVTLSTPDTERARAFYGAVLGWRFTSGNAPDGWNVEDRNPMIGIGGDPGHQGGATLCYRVADIGAALARVRQHGGVAGPAEPRPYGLLAECTDDQGTHFWLWQPTD